MIRQFPSTLKRVARSFSSFPSHSTKDENAAIMQDFFASLSQSTSEVKPVSVDTSAVADILSGFVSSTQKRGKHCILNRFSHY